MSDQNPRNIKDIERFQDLPAERKAIFYTMVIFIDANGLFFATREEMPDDFKLVILGVIAGFTILSILVPFGAFNWLIKRV